MAQGRKKKEIIPLENGLKENNLVQKSKPLFSLWKSALTLSEFKLLDSYLSRINSHEPEQRIITLEKGKIEELLGVKKINRKDLDTRLKHLQETTVEISYEGQIDRITLFERTQGMQDENGIWKVTVTCTPSAMKYIFNIERLGYLRYKIRSITQITSLYSYIMFTYLEYNRFRKSWEIELQALKDILNCTAESYEEYKEFNKKVLKKCHKELTEKVGLKYTYEPIRKGRKVASIRFTVETIADLIQQLSEPKELQLTENIEREYTNENIALLADACKNEFDNEEMFVIFHTINTAPLPPNQDGIWFARYHYLAKKYSEMELQAKKHKINNRFNYFKQILENDLF